MDTSESWYQETQRRYAVGESRHSAYQAFKRENPDAYAACLQTGRERALADLDGVWEATGIEGVVYPRDNLSLKSQKICDDYIATVLARLTMQGDSAAIGRIVMEQISRYADRVAEEFAEENWEAWEQ